MKFRYVFAVNIRRGPCVIERCFYEGDFENIYDAKAMAAAKFRPTLNSDERVEVMLLALAPCSH